MKSLADRLNRADLQYRYGLLSAEFFKCLDEAVYYMSLAAKSKHYKALKWLEHQEPHLQSAAYCLAQMYENGEGVTRSMDTAIEKYAFLVRQGYENALQQLLWLAGNRNYRAILVMADLSESYFTDMKDATKWHDMAGGVFLD